MKESLIIDKYLRPLAKGYGGALDLRDDAALLTVPPGEELVVTKDLILEGVHFIGNESPRLIAQKALRVNLSDLAAKGAIPFAYALGLALPDGIDEKWMAQFAAGLADDQKEFGITLMGGDTTRSRGGLAISVTAFGLVQPGKMIRRSGAKEGDLIYVTGTIGDAAIGLKVAQGKLEIKDAGVKNRYLSRYLLPIPRLKLFQNFGNFVTSAMDVSDGLLIDLGKLAGSSGLGAEIFASRVPVSDPTTRFIKESIIQWGDVFGGGDDYELLFTISAEHRGIVQDIASRFDLPVAEIGRIVAGSEVKVLDEQNKKIEVETAGYEHIIEQKT